jgi:hypothetical protein
VNGATCTAGTSPVVLLNLQSEFGVNLGACSGTMIAPRAILTGAHCLDDDVALVKVWLGTGPQVVAQSFAYYPNFRFNDTASRDVGIVRLDRDLGPAPVPLLTSRNARVGETAVIAGWGRDENNAPATLRAGAAVITAAGALHLETQVRPNGSSICSGDSGGALLLSEGGEWSIGGVISASSTTGCINSGTGFYVNLRNPEALSFVLEQVPEARQR